MFTLKAFHIIPYCVKIIFCAPLVSNKRIKFRADIFRRINGGGTFYKTFAFFYFISVPPAAFFLPFKKRTFNKAVFRFVYAGKNGLPDFFFKKRRLLPSFVRKQFYLRLCIFKSCFCTGSRTGKTVERLGKLRNLRFCRRNFTLSRPAPHIQFKIRFYKRNILLLYKRSFWNGGKRFCLFFKHFYF